MSLLFIPCQIIKGISREGPAEKTRTKIQKDILYEENYVESHFQSQKKAQGTCRDHVYPMGNASGKEANFWLTHYGILGLHQQSGILFSQFLAKGSTLCVVNRFAFQRLNFLLMSYYYIKKNIHNLIITIKIF